jgi:DNA-3-methyladenine glycosylase
VDVRPFSRALLAGDVPAVAPLLLGQLLVSTVGGDQVVARLVEVEAYAGAEDPASHAFRGRTARNAVMFGPAGFAYVYFSYGMHWCINVTCGPEGAAAAVLLRAATIVDGREVARARRQGADDRDLARGPARLTRALGIDGTRNGADLCGPAGPVRLVNADRVDPALIRSGPRVGVSRAADRPWRFWLDGDPGVSAYRPGGRAAGRDRKAVDP